MLLMTNNGQTLSVSRGGLLGVLNNKSLKVSGQFGLSWLAVVGAKLEPAQNG
jgi:hypothetical protein